jgi:Tol biopolymer transport system component
MFRVPRVRPSAAALLLAVSVAPPAWAGVELISKLSPRYVSDTGAAPSEARAISADGRYAAFVSEAANLVPGQVDTNAGPDVFVYDRMTGTTELVSRSADSPTATGNGPSLEVSISGNGRFVAFASLASDLADGASDGNGVSDVFVHDRVTGRTDLVSHAHYSRNVAGNNRSLQPEISADGRFIAFYSEARNLVQKPGQHLRDVFLYDRSAGTTELVSRGIAPSPQAGGTTSFLPAINANGRFVVFLSYAQDLVPGQRDPWAAAPDVFLYDRVAKKTTLVSHAASSPTLASNGSSSRRPAISADGSTVVFDSSGGDLVPGQRNPGAGQHVFLYHRPTGTTSLVNHAASSLTTRGNSVTGPYVVSADGSFVAFTSLARNLVAGQADRPARTLDVFLYQRSNGRIALVSGAGGSATVTANASSSVRRISADGNLILFQSDATDLVRGVADGNGGADVFLHDRRTKKTVLVSHAEDSASRTGNRTSLGSVLSADGKWVAFESAATDLVSEAQDFNEGTDVFLDGGAAGRELVSRRAPDLPSDSAQAASRAESISADGRFVVFTSNSSWLVDGQRDPNGGTDVFLRDRALGTNLLVSHSAADPKAAGNAPSGHDSRCNTPFSSPRISADGHFVVFASCATDLTFDPASPTVPDGSADLFLYNREIGIVTRIGGPSLAPPAISADGLFVVSVDYLGSDFTTVSLYDRAARTSTQIYGPARVVAAFLSADGRFVAFHAWRGGFSTPTTDYFLYDRVTGTTKVIDSAGGGPLAISADGRFVAFRSTSTALVPGQADDPGTVDVFLYDRVSGAYTLVTHAPGSPGTATGGHEAYGEMELSADGRFLAFASAADIFLFDRETGAVTRVSPEDGESWSNPRISADGRIVAFTNRAEPSLQRVLRYDRVTGALVTVTGRGASGPLLSANGDVLAFTQAISGLSDSTDAFVYIP